MNIVVTGVPFDAYSSYRRGPAEAPQRIREAFYSRSTNRGAESGRDLTALSGWTFGDILNIPNEPAGYFEIESAIRSLLAARSSVISLGGDHSITYPILRAHHHIHGPLTVIQLDAHTDLYDELDGNRHSHACPFARIMEENLAGRLIQIGIRTLTPHQQRQVDRFGVEVIEMRHLERVAELAIEGPVYLSLDLDVLDPAFAPGVSHHEPGGLSTRKLLTLLQSLPGTLIGADIVEYNPDRDFNETTAMVAAKCLKELVDRMLN